MVALSEYTTRDVAELLGLTGAQVRSYVRAGLVSPARSETGEYRFSFQDVTVLRAARDLLRARIPPRRLRRALRNLRDQLPAGVPLSAVALGAEGGAVVARDDGAVWNPESGQVQLDFSPDTGSDVRPLADRRAERLRGAWNALDAQDWYELGLDLEALSPGDAREAYRHALELDPAHADARVNRGRLLHGAGRLADAEAEYREALRRQPHHVTAAFNLGILLDDLGRLEEAAAAYEHALNIDPCLADAHFNLAGVYERLGRREATLCHLRAYKRLTSGR